MDVPPQGILKSHHRFVYKWLIDLRRMFGAGLVGLCKETESKGATNGKRRYGIHKQGLLPAIRWHFLFGLI